MFVNHDFESCQLHTSDYLHRADSYAIPRLEKLHDLESGGIIFYNYHAPNKTYTYDIYNNMNIV